MGNSSFEIGPLELEVVGILNDGGEQSVTDIQARLKESGRELAYTTVMTVLVRLHKKNLTLRRKEGRLFLYSHAKKKDVSTSRIFEKFKNSLFRTDRLKPILALLTSDDELSKAELQELKRAVDERLARTKK